MALVVRRAILLAVLQIAYAVTDGRLRSLQFAVPAAPTEIDPREWHGQELQDCIAATLHNFKKGGFFVDLAANDAVTFSNTFSLEQRYGWRGLCVEPNPTYHQRLLQLRNCSVVAAAVSDVEGQASFEFLQEKPPLDESRYAYSHGVYGHLAKRMSKTATAVWTVPFSKLLTETGVPRTIDFMSLDCEGSEEKVMQTFPWRTHIISVLAVEYPSAGLKASLEKHGYQSICRAGTARDQLYVHWESMGPGISRLFPTVDWRKAVHSSCAELLFASGGECEAAHRRHRKSNYRITGMLRTHTN